jgi:hypothetical protein
MVERMRTAPALPRESWLRRELRALAMQYSVLDDAAFALARAGILTAGQAKAAHKKIERAREGEFKKVLRKARGKAPRRVVPKRTHKVNKPITG